MARTPDSTFLKRILLAITNTSRNVLSEQFEPRLKGSITDATGPREAVGGLLDVALLAGHIEVGVSLRDGELIGRLTEAAEDALKTVSLLLQQVITPL